MHDGAYNKYYNKSDFGPVLWETASLDAFYGAKSLFLPLVTKPGNLDFQYWIMVLHQSHKVSLYS